MLDKGEYCEDSSFELDCVVMEPSLDAEFVPGMPKFSKPELADPAKLVDSLGSRLLPIDGGSKLAPCRCIVAPMPTGGFTSSRN